MNIVIFPDKVNRYWCLVNSTPPTILCDTFETLNVFRSLSEIDIILILFNFSFFHKLNLIVFLTKVNRWL